MADYDFAKIEKKLSKYLDEDRFQHTMGVMYTSACLAMVHGYDIKDAQVAGLLHDCAKCIPREVTTDSFYWVSRMIGAMADASYKSSIFHIERYQECVMSKGHQLIGKYDALLEKESDAAKRMSLRHQANQEIADMVKKEASDTLNKVLYELSNQMKNAYSRSDA